MTIEAKIIQMDLLVGDDSHIEHDCDVLYVNNRKLHWDTSAERAGQAEMVAPAFGHVLVGGYGLGISQQILLQNPKVVSVQTVEKYRAVTDACKARYGKLYGNVCIEDIFDYFNRVPKIGHFDTIIGDIWSGGIAADIAGYKRFRKAARPHLNKGGQILLGPRDI